MLRAPKAFKQEWTHEQKSQKDAEPHDKLVLWCDSGDEHQHQAMAAGNSVIEGLLTILKSGKAPFPSCRGGTGLHHQEVVQLAKPRHHSAAPTES